METIRINEDRLKVVLTREELIRYGLTDRPLDPDSEEVGHALRRLAADAGLDAAGGRLHLQLFESQGGSCELFVTRLPPEIEDGPPTGGYLVFDAIEDVVLLAKALAREGFGRESRLLGGGGRFFLLFPEGIPKIACEFGSILPPAAEPYIEEYADSLLTASAVERLAAW
jgi:negative regulator of genetic competence, sporulation and motility